MKKVLHSVMLSCRKATELSEKKSVVKLTALETIKLKLHLGFCEACSLYSKQSIMIDRILTRQLSTRFQLESEILSNDELKKNIILKIDKR